jgi:hypothetical protein
MHLFSASSHQKRVTTFTTCTKRRLLLYLYFYFLFLVLHCVFRSIPKEHRASSMAFPSPLASLFFFFSAASRTLRVTKFWQTVDHITTGSVLLLALIIVSLDRGHHTHGKAREFFMLCSDRRIRLVCFRQRLKRVMILDKSMKEYGRRTHLVLLWKMVCCMRRRRRFCNTRV